MKNRNIIHWLWLALVICLLDAAPAHAFYNPQQGRWLSREPIEEKEREELNPYAFCENESVVSVDVLGLYKITGDVITIESGDTLWAISRATGIPLEELLAANGGSDLIKPGQKFRRPKPTKPPSPPKPPNPSQKDSTCKICTSGFWTADVAYQVRGAMYVWGSFAGRVICSSDKSLTASVSGSANGMGIQAGYIKGESKVGFWAKSSKDLVGQTAGVFLASVGFGFGPINIFGISGNVGAAPGLIVDADRKYDKGPSTDFSVTDVLEKPNLGFGGGAGFIGLRIKKVN